MECALGLGGNIGDVAATMAKALTMLDGTPGCSITAVSSLYRTPPWGRIDQAPFLNACALVRTELTPHAMLQLCLETERALKRNRKTGERWGPRTIDIDMLTYGTEALEENDLTLPHPRMTERSFVLLPLAEIAPGLEVNGRSIADWLEQADTTGIERLRERDWWRGKGAV
jgi:2-amino-4-hydroxy-6-hydroxymethyldihydropteridine diphosphokinase